jgi:hypothetical protein
VINFLMTLWPMMSHDLCAYIILVICWQWDQIIWF